MSMLEQWVRDLDAQHDQALRNRAFLYEAGQSIPTDPEAVQRLVRQYETIPPLPPAEHRCAWCGGWSAAQLCPHCGGPR